MLLALLEFSDYVIVGILVAWFAGGTAIASRRSAANAAAGERLRRIEDKLNLLLDQAGIDYTPRTKERWQRLAEENLQKDAVREYCTTHSVSQAEAEDVVEQYLMDIRRQS